MKTVVLGLSGGMDSATLCGFYRDMGYRVLPIFFSYGSKHNQYEKEAAFALADFYRLDLKEINLDFIKDHFRSNLLQSGGDIPEGKYDDANMSQTVVPGRNVIFISIMMGYAWSQGAEVIAIGAHAGDHAIYDDCRAGFIAAMNAAVIAGSGDRVHVEAPFQYEDKASILHIGYHLKVPVPYGLTRTCYKDQPQSCGKCGSCNERLEAFNLIGKTDPVLY